MASFNRGKRRKKSKHASVQTYDISILPNGAVTAVAAPRRDTLRYLDLHGLVPEDVHLWEEARIKAMAQVDRDSPVATWERVLMLLAHHRSQLAHDLLMALEHEVPKHLGAVWELARGESVGWLGYNFQRDGDGKITMTPAAPAWVEGTGWLPGMRNN